MIKVGVVLAGCGYLDGAEIQEAVLTLLSLEKAKVDVLCMAPDMEQFHVVNHLTGQPTNEKRNVLVEAARIARGKIFDIKTVKAGNLDALIFPGGYGAAKNLCTYGIKGIGCEVHPDVSTLVQEMAKEKKPIGVMCIAPAMLVKILGSTGMNPTLTIGTDEATAYDIEQMGGKHRKSQVTEIIVDRKNRIVSTPAYMLGPNTAAVAKGIDKLVKEVLVMAKRKKK
jgi:enhancing lycopene biosynthesis protein 2